MKLLNKQNKNTEINFKPGDLLKIIDKSSLNQSKYTGICIGIKKRQLNSTVKIYQKGIKDNNIEFTFPINNKIFKIEIIKKNKKKKRGKLYYLKSK